jgi:hypothetical protein
MSAFLKICHSLNKRVRELSPNGRADLRSFSGDRTRTVKPRHQ